jgi:hypothetical protein
MVHLCCAALTVGLVLSSLNAGAETRRDVFVDPYAPPGGDGTREAPYASIQETVEKHDADWGQVFLQPGVYREDVDIHRGRFWFFPAQQYGVELQGSITVRRPGTRIRGLTVHSAGSGIILAEGATQCEVQHCRITAVGEGCAGIDVAADGVAGCLINGNVIELDEGADRAGIRVRVGAGVIGNRLDHNKIAGCEVGIDLHAGEGCTDETNIVSGNQVLRNAIGLLADAPGLTAVWNTFRDNLRAGAEVTGGSATIDGNRVEGNARGMVVSGGEVTLSNNVVTQNAEAGIDVSGGKASLLHNTLHHEADAPLLTVAGDAEVTARYNILAGAQPIALTGGQLSAYRNLFPERIASDIAGDEPVFGEPGFVDAARGDLRLQPGSPVARAADDIEVTCDADGVGRPRGDAASLGAYEAPGAVAGREIHVAAGAEDGDGSAGRPFASVAAALEGVRPGDSVILHPGEYEENVTISAHGAPDAPVTIRAQAARQVTLQRSTWTLADAAYVRIEGIDFREPSGAGLALGPYVQHCEFVDNRVIREAEGGGSGISVSGPTSSHNLFERNVIQLNHGGVGLQIGCQRHNWHITIRGNEISGCYYGIQTGGGSYPTAPPGYHLIEYNELHSNWKDGFHSKTTDNIFRGNDVHHNSSHGITTRYGSRNVFVGNWIHDNGSGMRLHSKSHFVINNLIYNNRGNGIYLGSWPGGQEGRFPYNFEPSYEPPHEVWIAHNTIAGNGEAPVSVDSGAQVMLLRNILVGNDDVQPAIVFGPGGVARQVEQNLYWKARPPLLREYEGGEYDRVADPLFLDAEHGDFRVSDDSPARTVTPLGDALLFVLSSQPAAFELGHQIGANLGPPGSGLPAE